MVPLFASTLLTWTWLVNYWDDLAQQGPGPPLVIEGLPSTLTHGPPLLRGALTWLPAHISDLLQLMLQAVWQPSDVSEAPLEIPNMPHPAGISRRWSMLYVWLQYAQWYKVLCWILIVVVGASDGLLPATTRQLFRIEELLLASDSRTQLFFFGQICPFVMSKARHFLVIWAAFCWPVRFFFYSVFTSHIDVAMNVICDTCVLLALATDWLTNVANDFRLRLNLNRLRSGTLTVASKRHHED
mmetsp:Transcript_19463/g.32496  ORF Transcript_19463/g.32496 Transcript_19463/m.32496 type:complete len:242 (+) Transcript_19463:213-938(+)